MIRLLLALQLAAPGGLTISVCQQGSCWWDAWLYQSPAFSYHSATDTFPEYWELHRADSECLVGGSVPYTGDAFSVWVNGVSVLPAATVVVGRVRSIPTNACDVHIFPADPGQPLGWQPTDDVRVKLPMDPWQCWYGGSCVAACAAGMADCSGQ